MQPVAFIYILTNMHHTVLYVGMTTDLRSRLREHQTKVNRYSFTARYNVVKPVYYEGLDSKEEALERELFIKGKTRKWKAALINSSNPRWLDLTEEIMNLDP